MGIWLVQGRGLGRQLLSQINPFPVVRGSCYVAGANPGCFESEGFPDFTCRERVEPDVFMDPSGQEKFRVSMFIWGKRCMPGAKLIIGRGEMIVVQKTYEHETAYVHCLQDIERLIRTEFPQGNIKTLLGSAVLHYRGWTQQEAAQKLGIAVPPPPIGPGLHNVALFRGTCGRVVAPADSQDPPWDGEPPLPGLPTPPVPALAPPPPRMVQHEGFVDVGEVIGQGASPGSEANAIERAKEHALYVAGVTKKCVGTEQAAEAQFMCPDNSWQEVSKPTASIVTLGDCVTTAIRRIPVASGVANYGADVKCRVRCLYSQMCQQEVVPVAVTPTPFVTATPTISPRPTPTGNPLQTVWCPTLSKSTYENLYWGVTCCQEHPDTTEGKAKCNHPPPYYTQKSKCVQLNARSSYYKDVTYLGWAGWGWNQCSLAEVDATARAQGELEQIRANCPSGKATADCERVSCTRNFTGAAFATVKCTVTCAFNPRCE